MKILIYFFEMFIAKPKIGFLNCVQRQFIQEKKIHSILNVLNTNLKWSICHNIHSTPYWKVQKLLLFHIQLHQAIVMHWEPWHTFQMNCEAYFKFSSKKLWVRYMGYSADMPVSPDLQWCRFKSINMRAVSFIRISSRANAQLHMIISRNS